MEMYKIGLVSDTWTDNVRNKVLREMLTIARLARKRGIQLILGANCELKTLFAGVIEVVFAEDLLNCDTYRVYIDYDNRVESLSEVADPLAVLDRLPQDADYELVEINRGKRLPGLIVDKDPYYHALPVNRDIQIIQPTIDLDRPPPKNLKDTDWADYMV